MTNAGFARTQDLAIMYMNQGSAILSRAVKADKEGNIEEAIKLYDGARQKFLSVKHQPTATPAHVAKSTEVMNNCSERIRTLKGVLVQREQPTSPQQEPAAPPPPPQHDETPTPRKSLSKKLNSSAAISKPIIPQQEECGAWELFAKAVQVEHDGNFAVAMQLYQQALAMFNMMGMTESDAPDVHAQVEYCVQMCENRIKCLEFYPNESRDALAVSYFVEGVDIIRCIASGDDAETVAHTCEEAREKLRKAGLYADAGTPLAEEIQRKIAFCNTKIAEDEPAPVFKIEEPFMPFSDIIGSEKAKADVMNTLVIPAKSANLFSDKTNPAKIVLLFGPAGVNKNQFVEGIVTQVDCKMLISVDGYDLIGLNEQPANTLSTVFVKARALAPACLFIKNIDVLAPNMGDQQNPRVASVLGTLLKNLADLRGIVVVASSSLPWNIDSNLLQMFGKMVYIGHPDAAARRAFLSQELDLTHYNLTEEQIGNLVGKIERFTSSDIKCLVRTAAAIAVTGGDGDQEKTLLEWANNDKAPPVTITFADLSNALRDGLVAPSVGETNQAWFTEFAAAHQVAI